jgi:hypothetical protein
VAKDWLFNFEKGEKNKKNPKKPNKFEIKRKTTQPK